MAKMSMFFCFFLVVLIAMPTSSSSRMMLEADLEADFSSCVPHVCSKPFTRCSSGGFGCPKLDCIYGEYEPCCACPKCCPAP
ncbi:hypothetical protein MKW92_000860 [Papaver armeniacum]|nr:hypothetical protein MKW92_000860 [Papaver armeniacum]